MEKSDTMADVSSEMIVVTCADHHETLVKGLWNLWLDKQDVDLYFQFGRHLFAAHQILAKIFLSQEKLEQTGGFQSASDQSDVLNSLLEFMYNGTIRVAKERLDDLLDLAKQLDFVMLVNTLQRIKQSHSPNCLLHTHNNSSNATATPKLDTKVPTNQSEQAERNDKDAAKYHEPQRERESQTSLPPSNKTNRKLVRTRSIKPSKLKGRTIEIAARMRQSQNKREKVKPTKGIIKSKEVSDGICDSSEDDDDSAATKKRKKPLTVKKPRNTKTIKGCRETKSTVLPLPKSVTTSPMLECAECDFKTGEFIVYTNHVHTVHKVEVVRQPIKQWLCRLCEFRCANHRELTSHVSVEHPGEKPFKCPDCDGTYHRRADLNKHAKICRGEPRRDGRPICEQCGMILPNNYRLGVHMSRHRGERLFMCHVCGKVLSTAHSLSMHSRVHTGEKPHVCETCGKSFSDRTTLKRHLVLHVPNQPRHACHLCSRSFKRLDLLNAHTKQPHPAQQPHTEQSRAKQPHHKQQPHPAEGHVHRKRRGYVVSGDDNNVQQRRSRWGPIKVFACRLCRDPPVQGFRSDMERHQATAHPGQKIFGCSQCDFTTSRVSMLPIHARLHTGERPYKCDECGRDFRDPSNYRGHLKFHAQGEKSFRCALCSSMFHRRTNLKFHLKTVHKLTPDEAESRIVGGNLSLHKQVVQRQDQVEVNGGGADRVKDVVDGEIRDVIVFDPSMVYFIS